MHMEIVMKNFNRFCLLFAALFALPAFANQDPVKNRWVLAHEPVTAFKEAAEAFQKVVARESGGKMAVEIVTAREFNNGKAVSEHELFKRLTSGEFEMSQTYTTYLGSHSQKFWALDLPFLFRSHQHAAKVLDGKIGQELLASLGPANMQGLSFTYSGGYRIISTRDKEIHKLEDFKGLRIRVPAYSVVATKVMEKLGAVPAPLSPETGAEATSEGKIDGLESTLPRYWDLDNREVNRVVNETDHSLFLTSIVVNKKFFNSLTAEQQKILRTAALETARMERAKSVATGDEIRKKIAGDGVHTLVKMSPKEQARFRKAVLPVYAEFNQLFGKDLVHRIQQTY